MRWAREMGTVRSVALAFAVCWSCALIVGAFVVPVYSTASGSSTSTTDGSTTLVAHGSATLVAENGIGVLGVVLVPLCAAIIVAVTLWRRRSLVGAGPIAWMITGLFVVFNVLAMLSIGPFVLPAMIGLVVACASRETPASRLAVPPASGC